MRRLTWLHSNRHGHGLPGLDGFWHMSTAWTYFLDMSKKIYKIDTFGKHVEAIDMFRKRVET
jgi:hypothetical protein